MKLGIISDTHDHLDSNLPRLFKGVDHILHAGDVGMPWVLKALEQIAPVTAVTGNTDQGLTLKETEVIELGGRKFLVHHIVEPRELDAALQRKIGRARPDVVVFGHTHKRFCQILNGILFFNPGYAGKQRFKLERSIAILEWTDKGIQPQYIELH
ncbi:MAG TPA: metallophosphoesterase family protein [Verrucomicrobiae bacterium]|nr:metallophosphoesterase family protein [Verrucomicrobiae bacterium]